MSRFFRSPNSSGSESDSDDEEALNSSLSSLEISTTSQQDLGTAADQESTTFALERSRNSSAQFGRDFLVHALLEERCMNQAIEERRRSGRSTTNISDIRREARERYRALCLQLAPLHLVSAGLDDDRHSSTRQTIRDGLDRIASTSSNTELASRQQQAAFSGPFRRLITAPDMATSLPSDMPFATVPGTPASLLDGAISSMPSLMQSRYIQDYEEIGILGKGGFGQVFHVRHKLDDCTYAVKKIPLRPSSIAQVESSGGQQALEELLAEVRSLSKLQHPNVVRYYNSWIEWSIRNGYSSSSSNGLIPSVDSPNAVTGAEEPRSADSFAAPLNRVKTQSDTAESIGFTFETSGSLQARSESVVSLSATNGAGPSVTFDDSSTDGSQGGHLSSTEPVLALHIQMSIHPMTLADFLSPPTTASVKPLAHCYHLEPSIGILLALLDGVEYLHAEGVVHRDLKPANIFLKHESNPKAVPGCVDLSLCADCRAEGSTNPATLSVCIGDFGLVTQIAQHANISHSTPTKAVGTEIYRPTSSKSNVSPGLDIFALGIIACELLCKFGTQMERRETLHSLRQGLFPKKLDHCAGHHSTNVKECIAAMLLDDDEVEHSMRIADVRRRLLAVLPQTPKVENGESALRRSST